MLIYCCRLSDSALVGSVNRRKIAHMAANKVVKTCEISEFKGRLLGDDWWGEYPERRVIDFDHGYKILGR